MDTGELTDLGGGGVLGDRRTAEEQELAVGVEVTITGPTGAVDTFRFDAISDDMTMLGAVWTLTPDDYVVLNPEALHDFIADLIDDRADLVTASAEFVDPAAQYPSVSVPPSAGSLRH